ncbi:MAG TPA: alpha/beta hydrolase [Candidatus Dormibacteraeota bacterium]|nr:alpha/beta hydrolase [Candidatus Dormibacteraeota bacterium]
MTASQHMVQANGLRFRTMVDGPPAGELVILLHGFPEGAESWSKQVDALARAGALVLAPDMRGYGMTDAPDAVEAYRIETLVDDVAGIVRAFGREQAHVAGHDWGAIVAWFFAARHPEMTKTLTVLSVGHPAAIAEATRRDEDQIARSQYIQLFLMQGKAEHVLGEDDYRRLRTMYSIGPDPNAIPRPVVERYVRSMSRPGRLTAGLNYYRANLRPGTGWSALARQLSITAPTALLWGDQDPALGRLQADKTAEYMQGEYRLEVLEGAGHWLQFERPVEVGRALVDSLSK